nr:hypothetical protein [uncultured Flavobacterium sp.]
MITRAFFPNPRFNFMSYSNGQLTISFKRGNERVYECEPSLAYELYYCSNSSAELSVYANKIKGKLKVLNVKQV